MRLKAAVIPTLALALCAAGAPALAQNRANSFELGPYVTFNDFDRDIPIEDDGGLGFRFGYNFTPMHEIEFLFDGVSDAEDRDFTFLEWDVGKFQANYVLNFNFGPNQKVVPYFTAGVGTIRFEVNDPLFGSEDEIDDLFDIGGGVRFFFGHIFNLRIDARSIYFEGDNDLLVDDDYQNRELSVGVGWVLGSP